MSEDRTRAVWAVLPVKAFAHGKSRLGGVLTDSVRAAFARGLFEHVVGTLRAAPSIAGIVVVTNDDEVEERARAFGLEVERDPPGASLSLAVDAGLAHAARRGATAGFVCMADLPRMAVHEVEAVVAQLAAHPVVVVPDLVEAGTNVFCQAPPAAFPSCFGRADSFEQHLARARSLGFEASVLRLAGLCFDVDGPQDLERISG